MLHKSSVNPGVVVTAMVELYHIRYSNSKGNRATVSFKDKPISYLHNAIAWQKQTDSVSLTKMK